MNDNQFSLIQMAGAVLVFAIWYWLSRFGMAVALLGPGSVAACVCFWRSFGSEIEPRIIARALWYLIVTALLVTAFILLNVIVG